MTQADSVHSTPPLNTSVHNDTTRRRFLCQAAAVAAGGAALGMALPLPVSAGGAEQVPDPILAAIETHKAAVVEAVAAHARFAALENRLADNGRLQYERRTDDETRRGKEIEAARDAAWEAETDAANVLLDTDLTTLAGVVALLVYARDHDAANDSIGWPTDYVDVNSAVSERRTWEQSLIVRLAATCPELTREAV